MARSAHIGGQSELDWLREHLDGVEGGPTQFKAWCPVHDDFGSSMKGLSITLKAGKVLVKCHSDHCGATLPDVRRALRERSNGQDDSSNGRVLQESGQANASAPDRRIVATYDYVDQDGNLLYQSVRYEPKDFRPRRKVNDGWVYNLNGTPRVLYRLPEVIAGRGGEIWIADGEKDCDRLAALGVVATTAKPWDDAYADYFRGARVTIIRDLDSGAGAKQAKTIYRSLLGVARSVRIVEALVGKDAADHLDAGHTLDEFVPADRFVRVDLAEVIEGGIEKPPFLVEHVLYKGKSHALFGEPGDGKTLLMLGLAVCVISSGRTVAWFDEENGAAVIASRLVTLGADIEDVRERLAYYPFAEPALDDAAGLVAEMEALDPALVVFDSGADMYEASSLNENDAMDMTRWARAFTQRLARAFGIASVVLEHVAKNSDSSYQRGSGAKKAKVDASWRMEVHAPFDHETVGEVSLVRAKDRLAHLPPEVRYRIGGDGTGRTVFERIDVEDKQEQRDADVKAKRDFFAREATTILLREGAFDRDSGLSQRQLTGLLSPAPQVFKNDVVQTLAKDPTSCVSSGAGARNSLIYWVEKQESEDRFE